MVKKVFSAENCPAQPENFYDGGFIELTLGFHLSGPVRRSGQEQARNRQNNVGRCPKNVIFGKISDFSVADVNMNVFIKI